MNGETVDFTLLRGGRLRDGLPAASEYAAIARFVLAAEGFRAPAALTLELVTPLRIQALNRHFRGVDRETDVISFRNDLPDTPTRARARRSGPGGLEGDIAINVSLAKRQAAKVGHPHAREMRLLWIHALLHLMGYSDYEPAARRTMFKRQAALLKRWERQRQYAC